MGTAIASLPLRWGITTIPIWRSTRSARTESFYDERRPERNLQLRWDEDPAFSSEIRIFRHSAALPVKNPLLFVESAVRGLGLDFMDLRWIPEAGHEAVSAGIGLPLGYWGAPLPNVATDFALTALLEAMALTAMVYDESRIRSHEDVSLELTPDPGLCADFPQGLRRATQMCDSPRMRPDSTTLYDAAAHCLAVSCGLISSFQLSRTQAASETHAMRILTSFL